MVRRMKSLGSSKAFLFPVFLLQFKSDNLISSTPFSIILPLIEYNICFLECMDNFVNKNKEAK